MAKLVLKDANIVFNGTDISANVASITLSTTAAEVATTAFGSSAVTRVSGLIDNSVTLSVHNDYNAIDGLFFPLVGSPWSSNQTARPSPQQRTRRTRSACSSPSGLQ